MPERYHMQDALNALTDILNLHYETGEHKIPSRNPIPTEKISDFPFTVTFARTGRINQSPVGVMKSLDTLVLQLHLARTAALLDEVTALMFYSDDIPMLIMGDPNLALTVKVVNEIRYTFGPLNWGGQKLTIGWEWEIDVKRQNTIETTIQQTN